MPKVRTAAEQRALDFAELWEAPQLDDPEGFSTPVVDEFDESKEREIPSSKGRLRFRRPLDVESEKYNTIPREQFSAAEAEMAVDDVFAALDGDSDVDAESAGDDVGEEEYVELLEAKSRKRPRTASDDDVATQFAELRKRQVMATVKHTTHNEEAVANVRQLLDSLRYLVRLRARLQPCVRRAVQMPQHDVIHHYRELVKDAYTNASNELHRLGEDLRVFADAAFGLSGGIAFEEVCAKLHDLAIEKADRTLEAFQDIGTTAVTKTLSVVGQPLIVQVKAALSAKGKIIRRVQRNHQHLRIFGHASHLFLDANQRARQIAEGDFDDEVFDDVDFLNSLVRREGTALARLEVKAAAEVRVKDATCSQPLHGRVGLHRRTKGKALDFTPRPKLCGFMAAVPYPDTPHYDALIKSLFGNAT